jgi:hypothetical protein
MKHKLRTEHAGAKNGGGFWGYREEAKELSRSARRRNDREAIDAALAEADEMDEDDYALMAHVFGWDDDWTGDKEIWGLGAGPW